MTNVLLQRRNGGDIVKIKWKTLKDDFKYTTKTIADINKKLVQVGVFDGEHAWLAGIHEYGCNIKAKNANWLTIPISPKARGKKASDFPNIFSFTSKNGTRFLAIPKSKNDMEILFLLTKEVHIPERSFLRNGYDDSINDVIHRSEALLNKLLDKQIDTDVFLNLIGQTLATKIKTYAASLSSPPNSGLTAEVKGSDNPLNDTGNLINSISWRIE